MLQMLRSMRSTCWDLLRSAEICSWRSFQPLSDPPSSTSSTSQLHSIHDIHGVDDFLMIFGGFDHGVPDHENSWKPDAFWGYGFWLRILEEWPVASRMIPARKMTVARKGGVCQSHVFRIDGTNWKLRYLRCISCFFHAVFRKQLKLKKSICWCEEPALAEQTLCMETDSTQFQRISWSSFDEFQVMNSAVSDGISEVFSEAYQWYSLGPTEVRPSRTCYWYDTMRHWKSMKITGNPWKLQRTWGAVLCRAWIVVNGSSSFSYFWVFLLCFCSRLLACRLLGCPSDLAF